MSAVLLVADASDAHARRLSDALARSGVAAACLSPSDFPTRVTVSLRPNRAGWETITGPFGRLDLADVTAAFLRPSGQPAPGPWSSDDALGAWTRTESRLALESLEASLRGRWMPASPGGARGASLKTVQLAAAAECGLDTPRTLVTNDPEAVVAFYEETAGCLVSKTLQARRADVEGVARFAFTHEVRRRDLTNLVALRNGPVLLQERIAKRCEIRATVVGDAVLAGEVDSQAVPSTRDDWRRLADPPLRWSPHELPAAVREGLLRLHQRLGISFSGTDLILTPEGSYVFLEANPLGDWLFLEERTGLPVTETVVDRLIAGAPGAAA